MGVLRRANVPARVLSASLLLCLCLVGCGGKTASEPVAVDAQERVEAQRQTTDETTAPATSDKGGAEVAADKDVGQVGEPDEGDAHEADVVAKPADGQPEAGGSSGQDDDVLLAVGDKEYAGYVTSLSNGLGARVTSLRLRAVGDADYGASLLHDGREIAVNEVVRLYVPRAGQDDAVTYDLLVSVVSDQGDERELEFLAALAPTYDSVTLRTEGDEAFVDYLTTSYEAGTTQEGREAVDAAPTGDIDPNDLVLR